MEKEALDLLKGAGIALAPGGKDFGRFCRRLLRAKQEVLRSEADRWDGKYTEDAATLGNGSTVPTPAVTLPPSKPFYEVLATYCKENPRPIRTRAQVDAEYVRFMQGLPKGPKTHIATISKADCRRYKDDLLQVRKLSLAAVIKHLSILSAVFKWAAAQGFIPDGSNPVTGLSPNKRHAKKEAEGRAPRRPFTDAELLAVFGSEMFLSQREAHPERYWLVLLCLFQLCRREEAGQLALKDIQIDDGIPFLNITDEGIDQALKNPGSRRRVPLHPSVLDLGFLEYVERMKATGHARLFPQLQKGANGFSDPVGKFFSRLVTKAGLVDPALVLHSFQYGGIHKLHAAGAVHHIVEVLAGHTTGSVHDTVYSHRERLPLRLLLDELGKLRYDDVQQRLTAKEGTN